MAVIKLSSSVGGSTGWLGMMSSDSFSTNLNAIGYPGDKPWPTQWYYYCPGVSDSNAADSVTRNLCDIYPGQSGRWGAIRTARPAMPRRPASRGRVSEPQFHRQRSDASPPRAFLPPPQWELPQDLCGFPLRARHHQLPDLHLLHLGVHRIRLRRTLLQLPAAAHQHALL